MAGRFVMGLLFFISRLLKWSLYLILQLVKLALEALKIVLLLTCSVLKIFLLVFHGGRCKYKSKYTKSLKKETFCDKISTRQVNKDEVL